MIDVNELRKSVTFTLDGELYKVVDYQHHKTGRGKATIRIKIRNLRSGTLREQTFNSSDRVQDIRLDHRTVQYLYNDGQFLYFMDTETFEQFPLPDDLVADRMGFVKENTTIDVTFHESKPIGIDLPTTVELEVVEAEAAVKGNTATNVKKEAKVETGMIVKVPMHIGVGDKIKVNTDTGDFQGRVT